MNVYEKCSNPPGFACCQRVFLKVHTGSLFQKVVSARTRSPCEVKDLPGTGVLLKISQKHRAECHPQCQYTAVIGPLTTSRKQEGVREQQSFVVCLVILQSGHLSVLWMRFWERKGSGDVAGRESIVGNQHTCNFENYRCPL